MYCKYSYEVDEPYVPRKYHNFTVGGYICDSNDIGFHHCAADGEAADDEGTAV